MSFAIDVSLNVRNETKRYEGEGAYLKAGHSNRCPQKAQMLNGEGLPQRGKGKANGLKGANQRAGAWRLCRRAFGKHAFVNALYVVTTAGPPVSTLT